MSTKTTRPGARARARPQNFVRTAKPNELNNNRPLLARQAPAAGSLGERAAEIASSEEQRREWRGRIAAAWRVSIEAIIRTGRLLVEAKGSLPHGDFTTMIEKELPFGGRTAQRLMRIANDRRLTDPTHGSHLPSSWRTLYELTRLSDEQFQRHLDAGRIKPDMERKDAIRLLAPPRPKAIKSGTSQKYYRYNDIPQGVIDVLNGTQWDIAATYFAMRKAKLSPTEMQMVGEMLMTGEMVNIDEAVAAIRVQYDGADARNRQGDAGVLGEGGALDLAPPAQQRDPKSLCPAAELRRLQAAWNAAGAEARAAFVSWAWKRNLLSIIDRMSPQLRDDSGKAVEPAASGEAG